MTQHGTEIQWTHIPGYKGETLNPTTGCSIVSPGCKNCYAMRLAGGFLRHVPAYKGLTETIKGKPAWSGEINFNEKALMRPLHHTKPRAYFVNSMSDLFHEKIPDAYLDKFFAVMALCPQHIFMILTKRPERMRDYLSHGKSYDERTNAIGAAVLELDNDRVLLSHALPLPNVWLGVSAEDQKRAEERIPVLLGTPAAIRFVSAEPLLGPVDFTHLKANGGLKLHAFLGDYFKKEWEHGIYVKRSTGSGGLDWVIVGGESGPGARPMNQEWAHDIRYQCEVAHVPFFMKQMAKKAPIPDDLMTREWPRVQNND